jgi:hypothetical protein
MLLDQSHFPRDAVMGRLRQSVGGPASIFALLESAYRSFERQNGVNANIVHKFWRIMTRSRQARRRMRSPVDGRQISQAEQRPPETVVRLPSTR